MSMPTDLLSVTEAAKAASVDPNTIRAWCDSGKIPHFRTDGGHRRISAAALEAHMHPTVAGKVQALDLPPHELISGLADLAEAWSKWEPDLARLGRQVGEDLLVSATQVRDALDEVIANTGYVLRDMDMHDPLDDTGLTYPRPTHDPYLDADLATVLRGDVGPDA